MNMKVIAILLVTIQLSGNFLTGLAQTDFGGSEECNFVITKSQTSVISNTASVIAVVNKNFIDQLDLIIQLSDFSYHLANKAIPSRPKNKTRKSQSNTCILPVSSFTEYKQIQTNINPGGRFTVNQAVVETLRLVIASPEGAWQSHPSFIRNKFNILPRGSLDDAIMTIKIYFKNPHWLAVNADFLFCPEACRV